MFRKIAIILTLITLFTCSLNPSLRAEEPIDINNHWAQDYILNALDRELMELYTDNTFKPDQSITRGEFATALARHLKLKEKEADYFRDVSGYPYKGYLHALRDREIINGYPGQTFKPDKTITRAEAITILIKSLGLKQQENIINLEQYQSFEDLPSTHWSSKQVKIADKIGLIPIEDSNFLYPNRPLTRAEAARYLGRLENLRGNNGYITDIYPQSQKISINLTNGERKVYTLLEEALIGRNNRLVSVEKILKTDKVYFISSTNGEIKYLKAYGMVTEEDLATEVSQMTEGLLHPDDIKALAGGDFSLLGPRLQEALQNRLTSQGLTAEEVTALLDTDWDQLENLSKNRIAEAIAMETGFPLAVTNSILEGDWDSIKTYAQAEAIQRVVQELFNSDLMS